VGRSKGSETFTVAMAIRRTRSWEAAGTSGSRTAPNDQSSGAVGVRRTQSWDARRGDQGRSSPDALTGSFALPNRAGSPVFQRALHCPAPAERLCIPEPMESSARKVAHWMAQNAVLVVEQSQGQDIDADLAAVIYIS